MPERLRIPLPCAQLPELVLNAINTIAVSSCMTVSGRQWPLADPTRGFLKNTISWIPSRCSLSLVFLAGYAVAHLGSSSATGARQRGEAGGGDGLGGGTPREQVRAHPGAAARHQEGGLQRPVTAKCGQPRHGVQCPRRRSLRVCDCRIWKCAASLNREPHSRPVNPHAGAIRPKGLEVRGVGRHRQPVAQSVHGSHRLWPPGELRSSCCLVILIKMSCVVSLKCMLH
jgi:hypothetical protein